MIHDRHRRLHELFTAAVELPIEARDHWLQKQCRGDSGLLDELRALIAEDEKSHDPLEAGINQFIGQQDGTIEDDSSSLRDDDAAKRNGKLPDSDIGSDEFCDQLSEIEVLSGDELTAWLDSVQPPGLRKDPQALAKRLIAEGKLTKFQATALMEGKSERLLIDKYLILDLIDSGGMGMVFKAIHRPMNRVVALKTLPPSRFSSTAAVQRFRREVQVAATLQHPNIVTAFDADESRGVHFLVMEYARGRDLYKTVTKHGPLDVTQAVGCIVQAASGLQHAHEHGIIHRDIKPGNLVLANRRTVKVLDMGLASIGQLIEPTGGNASSSSEQLTQSGTLLGTLAYMAPEQAADSTLADARSDIYSLGCTFYFLVTGDTPYGSGRVESISGHKSSAVPSLRDKRPDVPESVDRVFKQMLAKEPKDRQQSMAELIAQLKACEILTPAKTPSSDQAAEAAPSRASAIPPEFPSSAPPPVIRVRADSGKRRARHRVRDVAIVCAILIVAPAFFFLYPKWRNEGITPNGPPQSTTKLDPDAQRDVLPVMATAHLAPFRLAVNGLAGLETVESEAFQMDWHSATNWADIRRSEGEILFPSIPVSSYVVEIDLTMHGSQRALQVRVGDRDNGFAIILEAKKTDSNTIRCRLDSRQPFGGNKGRTTEIRANRRHHLQLYVSGARGHLSVNDLETLTLETLTKGSAPANVALSIHAGTGTEAEIHSVALRPLAPADADNCDWSDVGSRLTLDESATKLRLDQRNEGIAEKPVEGRDFQIASTGIVMNWVPPGQVTLGKGRADWKEYGRGLVPVAFPNGFWMGRYELTQSEWDTLMNDSPSRITGSKYLPVNWVSFDEALEFCIRLTEREHKAGRIADDMVYRIPTEAEWEYVLKAGGQGIFAGRDGARLKMEEIAWNNGLSNRMREIGEKRPNAWGFYDMLGNVPEWCADHWKEYANTPAAEPIVDRLIVATDEEWRHVVRGGGYYWSGNATKPERRGRHHREPGVDVGLRIVLGKFLPEYPTKRQENRPVSRELVPINGDVPGSIEPSSVFAGRRGAMKSRLLATYGGTPETTQAIARGLEWLRRNQTESGSWSLQGPYRNIAEFENEVAATAMALLALMGDGSTHQEGDFAHQVDRGIQFLLANQDSNGYFCGNVPDSETRHRMYAQAQATIAICELSGMTTDPLLFGPANLALEFAINAQSQQGGWRYGPWNDSDTSVTAWFITALITGRASGLEIDPKVLENAAIYLNSVSRSQDSAYAYRIGWEKSSASMTAAGLFCRQHLGWEHDHPPLRVGIEMLLKDAPFDLDNHDTYYWYYATQLFRNVGGPQWEQWNEVMRVELPKEQVKDGREIGSWPPQDDQWGAEGGRLYTTCFSLLCLEAYYRHAPLYTTDEK